MPRFAFRFCVVYFALYAAATQLLGGLLMAPGRSFPAFGTHPPMRDITLWLAEHVFGIRGPLAYAGNSGDTVFHWVQTAWLAAVAVLAAAAWTALGRGRRGDDRLRPWFRLFLRFVLAAQMFYYGMAKVVPSQFPPPSLVTLVTPVGQLSLSDLLWTFIGASTAYQIFTGCAELLAGVLLLTPRTATLGAAIALIDMIQVFVLNMTYDFGLKQISFHLILIALVLLAPDGARLANVFLRGRPADGPAERPLFATPQANRAALIAQLAFGIYLLAMFTSLSLRYWRGDGGAAAPRSALYGIWDISELAIDGNLRPPGDNDYDRRWRRVIFDVPGTIVFQRLDDSFAHYGAVIDANRRTLALTKGHSRQWRATFTFDRAAPDRMTLEGEMDELRIRMRLQRRDEDTFRLLNSRFRWVRPPEPFAG